MARTPKLSTTQKKKVEKVMHEYKDGDLRSGKRGPGKGPKVKSRKQAVAIALSEAGASRPAKGARAKPARKTASSQAGARRTSPNRAGSRQTGGKQASARATTARRTNRRATGGQYESRA